MVIRVKRVSLLETGLDRLRIVLEFNQCADDLIELIND